MSRNTRKTSLLIITYRNTYAGMLFSLLLVSLSAKINTHPTLSSLALVLLFLTKIETGLSNLQVRLGRPYRPYSKKITCSPHSFCCCWNEHQNIRRVTAFWATMAWPETDSLGLSFSTVTIGASTELIACVMRQYKASAVHGCYLLIAQALEQHVHAHQPLVMLVVEIAALQMSCSIVISASSVYFSAEIICCTASAYGTCLVAILLHSSLFSTMRSFPNKLGAPGFMEG